jgi:hypothetical protein
MAMVTAKEKNEGWWRPWRADKWHYFLDGRSLCGKWGFPNADELLADDGRNSFADTCAGCRRKQAARREARS